VLFAVGYDRAGGLTHRQVYVGGLENVLDALAQSPSAAELRRFIYVSTTGVYAASDGWVDEDAPCAPNTPGAQAHFDAERLLAASPLADRAVVLRMAGLYGHERVPRREELLANRPISAASDGYLNLIHVDDAAAVAVLAGERSVTPSVFNVADGQPTNRREYLAEVARLFGAPPPRFVEPGKDDLPARGSASKRIGNRRMMAELAPTLAYPSFREGLAAATEFVGGESLRRWSSVGDSSAKEFASYRLDTGR
jgi:nucleoside-diphosphate-sugar epimerase